MHAEINLPPLEYSEWINTRDTLHLFLQIIGKIRMKAHPKLNHWWHVTLYPSVRGLTTGRIPYRDIGFEILFDMLDHRVVVTRNDGETRSFDVANLTVADFYSTIFNALSALDIEVSIYAVPFDNKSTVPFPDDTAKRAYDAEAVTRYWKALCSISSVFERFRARFVGKQTPVHLFWHSFDLALTRFSGKPYPLDAKRQSDREAYSHEVISVGFWPGDDTFQEAAFYGYAYPEPEGLGTTTLKPVSAEWVDKNGSAMAILLYDDLRRQDHPAAALLEFLQSVYDRSAALGQWPTEKLHHAPN